MTQLSPYWLNLAGGTAFDIERPTVEMIDPAAILHHLAMISRWGGNVQFPYSVLQHSILVAEAMTVPAERIYGLIHDWPEALLGGDIATPWKLYFHARGLDINALERRFMNLIYERLGIPSATAGIAARVHEADQKALATEFRDVVHGKSPHWSPKAPCLPRTIKHQHWSLVLERGHEMLDSCLYWTREAA